MQFNSYIYLLLFLPAAVILYYSANRVHLTAGKIVLLVFSLLFYSWGNVRYTLILAASILANFLLALLLRKTDRNKGILICGILINVLVLFYYKYYNFFVGSINDLLKTDIKFLQIMMPLGISFYTFQQISYLINIYRNKISNCSFLSYALYILYFPKILMGPITEPEELIAQFDDESRKKFDMDRLIPSIQMFTAGLFKKVILADTFARAVDWGFANLSVLTTVDTLIIILGYSLQIYFDFSGYSDMAMAASKMLNIDLPMNFNYPYKSFSIREFWRRWHMSLTGFLTEYIYKPLGGSRKGKARTYINTMIVFLVSGIWHGANWTFILWGLLHGFFSIMDRLFDRQKTKIPKLIQWCGTFLIVNLLWLLFRADSVSQWAGILGRLFQPVDLRITYEIIQAFDFSESLLIMRTLGLVDTYRIRRLMVIVFLLIGCGFSVLPERFTRLVYKKSALNMIIIAVVFGWCVLSLGTEPVFVYNNF